MYSSLHYGVEAINFMEQNNCRLLLGSIVRDMPKDDKQTTVKVSCSSYPSTCCASSSRNLRQFVMTNFLSFCKWKVVSRMVKQMSKCIINFVSSQQSGPIGTCQLLHFRTFENKKRQHSADVLPLSGLVLYYLIFKRLKMR